MKRSFALYCSVSLICASPVLALDKFNVAEACVQVSKYIDEISAVVLASTGKEVNDYNRLLGVARSKYESDLQLFRIVAGEKAQFFAFEDARGVYGIQDLAHACTSEKNCSKDVVSVIVGFSHFLIETCREDFLGDQN